LRTFCVIFLLIGLAFACTVCYCYFELANYDDLWHHYIENYPENIEGRARLTDKEKLFDKRAGRITLVFISTYILFYSITLIYLKTIVSKVISILGVVTAIISLVATFIATVVSEIYSFKSCVNMLGIFILYMIAFSIVLFFQTKRTIHKPAVLNQRTIDDIL